MQSSELEKKMMEVGIKKIKQFYADSVESGNDQQLIFVPNVGSVSQEVNGSKRR